MPVEHVNGSPRRIGDGCLERRITERECSHICLHVRAVCRVGVERHVAEWRLAGADIE